MVPRKKKPKLTPEQQRAANIFRLRGFYANAKTLPFNKAEMECILDCVDGALKRLGASTQSSRESGDES